MLTTEGIAAVQIGIAAADMTELQQLMHRRDYHNAHERLSAVIRQLEAARRMLA